MGKTLFRGHLRRRKPRSARSCQRFCSCCCDVKPKPKTLPHLKPKSKTANSSSKASKVNPSKSRAKSVRSLKSRKARAQLLKPVIVCVYRLSKHVLRVLAGKGSICACSVSYDGQLSPTAKAGENFCSTITRRLRSTPILPVVRENVLDRLRELSADWRNTSYPLSVIHHSASSDLDNVLGPELNLKTLFLQNLSICKKMSVGESAKENVTMSHPDENQANVANAQDQSSRPSLIESAPRKPGILRTTAVKPKPSSNSIPSGIIPFRLLGKRSGQLRSLLQSNPKRKLLTTSPSASRTPLQEKIHTQCEGLNIGISSVDSSNENGSDDDVLIIEPPSCLPPIQRLPQKPNSAVMSPLLRESLNRKKPELDSSGSASSASGKILSELQPPKKCATISSVISHCRPSPMIARTINPSSSRVSFPKANALSTSVNENVSLKSKDSVDMNYHSSSKRRNPNVPLPKLSVDRVNTIVLSDSSEDEHKKTTARTPPTKLNLAKKKVKPACKNPRKRKDSKIKATKKMGRGRPLKTSKNTNLQKRTPRNIGKYDTSDSDSEVLSSESETESPRYVSRTGRASFSAGCRSCPGCKLDTRKGKTKPKPRTKMRKPPPKMIRHKAEENGSENDVAKQRNNPRVAVIHGLISDSSDDESKVVREKSKSDMDVRLTIAGHHTDTSYGTDGSANALCLVPKVQCFYSDRDADGTLLLNEIESVDGDDARDYSSESSTVENFDSNEYTEFDSVTSSQGNSVPGDPAQAGDVRQEIRPNDSDNCKIGSSLKDDDQDPLCLPKPEDPMSEQQLMGFQPHNLECNTEADFKIEDEATEQSQTCLEQSITEQLLSVPGEVVISADTVDIHSNDDFSSFGLENDRKIVADPVVELLQGKVASTILVLDGANGQDVAVRQGIIESTAIPHDNPPSHTISENDPAKALDVSNAISANETGTAVSAGPAVELSSENESTVEVSTIQQNFTIESKVEMDPCRRNDETECIVEVETCTHNDESDITIEDSNCRLCVETDKMKEIKAFQQNEIGSPIEVKSSQPNMETEIATEAKASRKYGKGDTCAIEIESSHPSYRIRSPMEVQALLPGELERAIEAKVCPQNDNTELSEVEAFQQNENISIMEEQNDVTKRTVVEAVHEGSLLEMVCEQSNLENSDSAGVLDAQETFTAVPEPLKLLQELASGSNPDGRLQTATSESSSTYQDSRPHDRLRLLEIHVLQGCPSCKGSDSPEACLLSANDCGQDVHDSSNDKAPGDHEFSLLNGQESNFYDHISNLMIGCLNNMVESVKLDNREVIIKKVGPNASKHGIQTSYEEEQPDQDLTSIVKELNLPCLNPRLTIKKLPFTPSEGNSDSVVDTISQKTLLTTSYKFVETPKDHQVPENSCPMLSPTRSLYERKGYPTPIKRLNPRVVSVMKYDDLDIYNDEPSFNEPPVADRVELMSSKGFRLELNPEELPNINAFLGPKSSAEASSDIDELVFYNDEPPLNQTPIKKLKTCVVIETEDLGDLVIDNDAPPLNETNHGAVSRIQETTCSNEPDCLVISSDDEVQATSAPIDTSWSQPASTITAARAERTNRKKMPRKKRKLSDPVAAPSIVELQRSQTELLAMNPDYDIQSNSQQLWDISELDFSSQAIDEVVIDEAGCETVYQPSWEPLPSFQNCREVLHQPQVFSRQGHSLIGYHSGETPAACSSSGPAKEFLSSYVALDLSEPFRRSSEPETLKISDSDTLTASEEEEISVVSRPRNRVNNFVHTYVNGCDTKSVVHCVDSDSDDDVVMVSDVRPANNRLFNPPMPSGLDRDLLARNRRMIALNQSRPVLRNPLSGTPSLMIPSVVSRRELHPRRRKTSSVQPSSSVPRSIHSPYHAAQVLPVQMANGAGGPYYVLVVPPNNRQANPHR